MTRRDFVARVASAAFAAAPPFLGGCTATAEPPLRVGATIWPGYEPLFLARAEGHLDAHPIKLVEFSTTPEAIRTFKNGALEVLAVTGDEFLRLASEEPSLKAFLVTDFSNGADAFIAQPEFDCVAKLAGKRIGVEVNASGVFMLTNALAAVGMTKDHVKVVPIDNDQHVRAFQQREVDAVVTFEPRRTQLLKHGGKVLFDSSRAPAEHVDFLVARQSTLDRRADRIRALVDAWFAARHRLLAQPLAVAELLAPREGLTPAEFAAAVELIALPSLAENRRLLTNGESELIAGLRNVHGVLQRWGRFKAAAPSLSLFTEEALS